MTDTLFVTDLDGTLLQPDVTVSDRSRALLTEMLNQGLPLTVATARTAFSVMPILEGIPFRLPLILQNGAVLHDPIHNRIVSAAVIAPDAYHKVCALFAQYGFNGFVFCAPSDQILCCYTELTTPHMKRYYQERRVKYEKPFHQVSALPELAAMNPVFLSLNAPKEKLDPLHSSLLELKDISVTYYKDVYEPEIWYMEVSAPDASKYHGILKLKEMLGAKSVTGFGDNFNDVPLFRACDRKIAVANAADALKEQADLIIGSNTADAVAEYLHSIFFTKGEHI